MKLGLHRVSIWVNIQKDFKFLGHTVSEKNAMLTCKISKLFIWTILQLWISTRYHRIFLENCETKEHEIFFHRMSIWINIQKNFQVSRSHIMGEKCDANFKISSHFLKNCANRWTWSFFCIEYAYGSIYKNNLKLLGRTVSEKNVMLFSSYHRIFIKNCATDQHENFLHRVSIMG